MSGSLQNAQWIRAGSLIVASGVSPGSQQAPGLDLSQLRFTFTIRQQDAGAPNTAVIRVFNLKAETIKQIEREFTRVVVQAGYQNTSTGVIFDGTIKQTRVGRIRNVDGYLDILAAEGDLPYNFAVVNKTLAPGAKPSDQLSALNEAISGYGGSIEQPDGLIGGILPRGKVLFGMAMAGVDSVSKSTGYTWTIDRNGIVRLIPLTGYLPGEAVVLNSRTGLIGVPESTQQGLQVVCLINPKIRIGTRVQINNSLINQVTTNSGGVVPSYDNPFAGAYASVTADGFYRVIVQEYEGDSRGEAWFARLTCLAVDASAPPATSVPLYP